VDETATTAGRASVVEMDEKHFAATLGHFIDEVESNLSIM
jgi:hypothetical protein